MPPPLPIAELVNPETARKLRADGGYHAVRLYQERGDEAGVALLGLKDHRVARAVIQAWLLEHQSVSPTLWAILRYPKAEVRASLLEVPALWSEDLDLAERWRARLAPESARVWTGTILPWAFRHEKSYFNRYLALRAASTTFPSALPALTSDLDAALQIFRHPHAWLVSDLILDLVRSIPSLPSEHRTALLDTFRARVQESSFALYTYPIADALLAREEFDDAERAEILRLREFDSEHSVDGDSPE